MSIDKFLIVNIHSCVHPFPLFSYVQDKYMPSPAWVWTSPFSLFIHSTCRLSFTTLNAFGKRNSYSALDI